jgi:hypothetical protein
MNHYHEASENYCRRYAHVEPCGTQQRCITQYIHREIERVFCRVEGVMLCALTQNFQYYGELLEAHTAND